MIFEQFLKEARKNKGLTQKELADKAYTTYQNISSYERLRTECSFDIGMSLLNALDISVVIENNQIFVKEGNLKMENTFKRENLEFVNFNSEQVKEERTNWIKKNQELNAKQLEETLNALRNKGYDIYLGRVFDVNLWADDYYNNEDILATIVKDNKEIELSAVGYLDIDYFMLENFIEAISERYPQEAKFIEKAIMYTSYNNPNGGHDIYEAFKYNPSADSILEVLPVLKGYEDIVLDYLSSKDFFFTLREGHNPEELTIADFLRLYDCSSSMYLYYSFTMPTGDRVQAEESFEGHDVVDALSYAPEYFSDYDEYLEQYNDEDIREDLIIF